MKTKYLLTVCFIILHSSFILSTQAQGTAFTYQGRFNANNAPYTGAAEFQFTLWDAASGGAAVATNNPTSVIATVTAGLFTATLDFGSNPFNGQPRFLQVEARTAIGAFTPLTPRQPLTPAPYALRAFNLTTNGLAAGTYASAVTFNNAGNSFAGVFSGSHSGNGGSLTNVNAATLGGLSGASFWRTNGNAGANPTNGAFLGTTDNLPLEFKVNGQRALRIEYVTNFNYGGTMNIAGGFSSNIVGNGIAGAVIGGGGYAGGPNEVGNDFATVVGGLGNTANGFASTAMGFGSSARGNYSTAMGILSTASGGAATAMGYFSTANGDYSTAMGVNARALHDGAFVWADNQGVDFASTAPNQFCIRANGGVQLSGDTSVAFGTTTRQMLHFYGLGFGMGVQTGTLYARSNTRFSWFKGGVHSDTENAPGTGGTVLMSLLSSGLIVNGVVVSSSDRNMKENFAPVQPREVLDKVVALPLSSWNFKEDSATRHLGPMAQDFYAAFHVGPDDKHIATVDADGVALAAIQGLNQKLTEELKQKATEITGLKQRLEALERIILSRKPN